MNIEKPSIEESSGAFISKMNAARFFYEKLRNIYQPNNGITKIPNELFYYVDAIVFELHAASQMLLQIINIKSEVNENAHKVSWNRKFKEDLANKNNTFFNWWGEFNNSPEFHVLEAMRQHISHRGSGFLQAEIDEQDRIKLLSIPVRFRYYKNIPQQKPSGKSIELLDELIRIANYLNKSFKELKNL